MAGPTRERPFRLLQTFAQPCQNGPLFRHGLPGLAIEARGRGRYAFGGGRELADFLSVHGRFLPPLLYLPIVTFETARKGRGAWARRIACSASHI